MTSPSDSQTQDEDLQTQNPSPIQVEENPPPETQSQSQSYSPKTHTLEETPNPQNPIATQSEVNPPSPPQTPEEEQELQLHSSEVQTLQTPPDPQNQHHHPEEQSSLSFPQDQQNPEDPSQVFDQQDQVTEEKQVTHPEQEKQQQSESGMPLSPYLPAIVPPITDSHVTFSDAPLSSPANPPRRPNKRKKGKGNIKKQQAIEKKIQTLTENLNPIPFVPLKVLDFFNHKNLLKRLGLWDFVHIEFDRTIRVDLIAQLIATYDPKLRGSYVNELRIAVNRADLGRAFKLPVKKDKGVTVVEGVDLDSEAVSEESIGFIEEFVSCWVLLHEDTWIMPNEVLNWTRAMKDGNFEKVDWAGLLWFMVEKELAQGEQLVDCYYASHLQYLMKFQRVNMMREEPKEEIEVDLEVKELEDVGNDGDVTMGGPDECQEQQKDNAVLEEPNVELTLGQDFVEKEEVKDDEMMDVEESKEDAEEHGWILDGKNNVGHHFLQGCNLEENRALDSHEDRKEEGEEEEEEEVGGMQDDMDDGFNIAPSDDSIDGDGLTGNLLQAMEANQIAFSSQRQIRDQSSGKLIASRDEHAISHQSLNGSNKRMRTDDTWDNKPSDFRMCMEQMQQSMAKAMMIYDAKEQAFDESKLNQEFFLNELQKRDNVIEHLQKTSYEELQKRDKQIYRLERELYVMGNILDGYRKALKETDKSFAEYRQRCNIPEEALYKDAGPGGLMLSTTEIEKRLLKKEEEDRLNRIMLEQNAKEAEEGYARQFEVYLSKVIMLNERLMGLENVVKLLKELSAKRKVSETSERPLNE